MLAMQYLWICATTSGFPPIGVRQLRRPDDLDPLPASLMPPWQ
jgi:hypothetical protein